MTGDHLKESHTKRPNIGARSACLTVPDLGREVRQCSAEPTCVARGFVWVDGDAEVEQTGHVTLAETDVGRLDVAVHDAGVMGTRQPACKMLRHYADVGQRDQAAPQALT